MMVCKAIIFMQVKVRLSCGLVGVLTICAESQTSSTLHTDKTLVRVVRFLVLVKGVKTKST